MSEHAADVVVERVADELTLSADDWADGDYGYGVIRKILAELRPGDRLPGGLIVVPEEPTEAMVDTTMRAWMEAAPKGYVKRRVPSVARTLYRALLAASGGKQ